MFYKKINTMNYLYCQVKNIRVFSIICSQFFEINVLGSKVIDSQTKHFSSIRVIGVILTRNDFFKIFCRGFALDKNLLDIFVNFQYNRKELKKKNEFFKF